MSPFWITSSDPVRVAALLSDKQSNTFALCHFFSLCLLVVSVVFIVTAPSVVLLTVLCIHTVQSECTDVYICFEQRSLRLGACTVCPSVPMISVNVCACVFSSVCTSPVSLTHCHHRPMGKPPPTHFVICSVRCCVCVCVWERESVCACADVNKIGLVEAEWFSVSLCSGIKGFVCVVCVCVCVRDSKQGRLYWGRRGNAGCIFHLLLFGSEKF